MKLEILIVGPGIRVNLEIFIAYCLSRGAGVKLEILIACSGGRSEIRDSHCLSQGPGQG